MTLCTYKGNESPCVAEAKAGSPRQYCGPHEQMLFHDYALAFRRRQRRQTAADAERWAAIKGLDVAALQERAASNDGPHETADGPDRCGRGRAMTPKERRDAVIDLRDWALELRDADEDDETAAQRIQRRDRMRMLNTVANELDRIPEQP